MNCNEFEQRLEQAVESQGPTANEVAAFARHLEHCDGRECAALWADHERLTAAIGQWQQSVPVVDLVNCVVGELRDPAANSIGDGLDVPLRVTYGTVREPAVPTGQNWRSTQFSVSRWSTLATAAAALLLMFSLLMLTKPSSTDVTSVDTSAEQVERVDSDSVASADEPAGLPRERSYASMPLSATEFVTDAVVLVVPADLSEPDEEPSRADVWADRLSRRLEPIGRELSNTFETLLHAVPKTSS